MQSLNVRARLLQIVDELKAEGYRVTGTLGDSVFALKHTNGNRMTITAVDSKIGYIKNGILVKTDDVAALAAHAVAPANHGHVKNPK